MGKNIKQLLTKKNIIIFSIILILLIIVITIILIPKNYIPKEHKKLLGNKDYELTNKIQDEIEEDDNTKTPITIYTYEKNNIRVSISEHENFEEVKKSILVEYDQYKDMVGFNNMIRNKDNYIFIRLCDNNICLYNLGYENKLISSGTLAGEQSKADEVYDEILRENNLN